MKRIINTFKHGSLQAKGILAATMISGLAAIGFVACAVIFGQMLFFFVAIIAAFASVSLAQTFGIHEYDDIQNESTANDVHDLKPENIILNSDATVSLDYDDGSESEDRNDAKKTKRRNKKTKKTKKAKKVKSKKITKDKHNRRSKGEDISEEANEDIAKPSFNATHDESLMFGQPSETPEKRVEREEEKQQEKQEIAKAAPATVEELKTYNKRKLKKTFYKYKVKRDHRMVMVDHCDKFSIHQSPAYIWVHDKEFHMLLIEQEPRHIVLPLFSLKEITYLKKQPVNVDVDYAVFKGKSMLSEMFAPYLPDYSHSTVVDDMTAYKNLYGIGPDIYFTNRSAGNLLDLLNVEFYVEDKVTTSHKVNVYFKDAYKSNILLRDNVIDANQYADRISNILEDMAKSIISHNEFKETLNLMVKNKLITQEFAVYYMEVRDKVSH